MRDWLIKKLGGYTVSDVRDLQDKIMELRKNQRTGSEQIKEFEYGIIMKRNADLLDELTKANEQILAYEHEKNVWSTVNMSDAINGDDMLLIHHGYNDVHRLTKKQKEAALKKVAKMAKNLEKRTGAKVLVASQPRKAKGKK